MKGLAMRSAAQASAFRFPAHSIAGRVGTSFKHEHLQAILADGRRDRSALPLGRRRLNCGHPDLTRLDPSNMPR
jgi:hypothetical protein